MFCPACGKQNLDNVTFCYNCGADLRKITPGKNSQPSSQPNDPSSVSKDDVVTNSFKSSEGSVKLLSGRYQLSEEIGRGGMGVVYKAYDAKLNRIVAIKQLPKEITKNAKAIKLLKNEANVALSLSHPNILRLTNFEESGDEVYLIMEYVEGKSLSDIIFEETKLPLDLALEIGKQILNALNYAHAQNVVHRDLKPSNIIVSGKMDDVGVVHTVKIIDFGIARLVNDTMTKLTGTTTGTLIYMSPEQIKNKPQDKRSDIWSWGIVMYEMLHGTPPFNSDLQILHENPEHIKGIPDWLDAIIQKCLSKDPDDRFQSTEDILEAIQNKTAGKSKIIKTGKVEKNKSNDSRSVLFYGTLISILLILVIGGIILGLWLHKNSTKIEPAYIKVAIPAGKFQMGCSAQDKDCNKVEEPEHTVFLSAYKIDKNLVSVEFYHQCVEAGKCTPPATGKGCNSYMPSLYDHPVNCVSWDQAVEYCKWAGGQLPTEAQWEKAARGDKDDRIYPWGNEWDASKACFHKNSTCSDGSYPQGASPYGVMDMEGNVAQWVSDWYSPDYYSKGPKDWDNPTGPSSGQERVIKGAGYWASSSDFMRISKRKTIITPNAQIPGIGFRCVQSIK